ncbi:excisionase family DNA-binding protein [Mucisphaera sp.]|uniref:excisionase family DNA-binding protein n=1 Tax=Mucisphaera sp. TaxID=2913024 RepID=UPI003D0AA8A5
MASMNLAAPTAEEVEQARSAISIFRAHADSLGVGKGQEGHLRVRVEADGDLIELPAMVTRLLKDVLEHMAAGQAVSLLPLSGELTTQKAAELLGVSRPFLVKLLEKGEMSYRKVGLHRRVNVADVLAYRDRQQIARSEVLDDLAGMSQRAGDYD